MNAGCVKPRHCANWRADICAKSKSTSPSLLAIPAFDRIAGLCNRHLNSNKGICLLYRFQVRPRAMTDLTKGLCRGVTKLVMVRITFVVWLSGF
jgi:hypothetical protein